MNNIRMICKREPVTIDQNRSLQSAAQTMRDQHVGSLVITSNVPNGMAGRIEVVGFVTDRDLAVEALANGGANAHVPVGALFRGPVVAVRFDASISDAVQVMRDAGVRRLLVVGAQQELLSVVSLDDVIEAWADDLTAVAQALRKAREVETASAAVVPQVMQRATQAGPGDRVAPVQPAPLQPGSVPAGAAMGLSPFSGAAPYPPGPGQMTHPGFMMNAPVMGDGTDGERGGLPEGADGMLQGGAADAGFADPSPGRPRLDYSGLSS